MSPLNALFIAGTDTGVGKTHVTAELARNLKAQGQHVTTQKWIQSGGEDALEDLRVHMAALGETESDIAPYKTQRCPYFFSLPASPHLSAKTENKTIAPDTIIQAFTHLTQAFDWVLVEGSGGLMVPYSETHTMLDLLEKLKIPTLLVIDNKLGCINHTLLSVEALKTRNIPIKGLIFNETEPNRNKLIQENNIQTLKNFTKLRIVDTVSFQGTFNKKISCDK